MSGTVLAAIDLAHGEDHAAILTRAAKLAGIDGSRLAVITVIPDFGMSIIGDFFEEGTETKALEAANERLHAVVDEALGPEAEAKHIVGHGTAYEEILAAAETVGASLIVMGAHKPGLRDFLLGPNAARVVRHSNCSVFVIRHP